MMELLRKKIRTAGEEKVKFRKEKKLSSFSCRRRRRIWRITPVFISFDVMAVADLLSRDFRRCSNCNIWAPSLQCHQSGAQQLLTQAFGIARNFLPTQYWKCNGYLSSNLQKIYILKISKLKKNIARFYALILM